jgi:hypothetical protein
VLGVRRARGQKGGCTQFASHLASSHLSHTAAFAFVLTAPHSCVHCAAPCTADGPVNRFWFDGTSSYPKGMNITDLWEQVSACDHSAILDRIIELEIVERPGWSTRAHPMPLAVSRDPHVRSLALALDINHSLTCPTSSNPPAHTCSTCSISCAGV